LKEINDSLYLLQHWFERLNLNQSVMALGFARMADAMGNSMLIITIPLFVIQVAQPDWSVPDTILIGVLISTYGLVYALAQPLTGILIDRLQRHKIIIQAGQILIGCSALAFTQVHHYGTLFIVRLLQGVGLALMVPASLALLAGLGEKRVRGGSMGLYVSMRQIGIGLGPITGGWLILKFGFNAVFLIAGALVLLSAGLVQLMVKELPTVERGTPTARGEQFRYDPGIISLGIANFMMASSMMMITTLEGEFNTRLQQTVLGFGLAFSAFTFTRLLFQWPIGRLSDRIGRKPLILWGLILLAPTTMLLGWVTSTLQLTSLRALQGICSSAIAAPTFALAADLSPPGHRGRQMSIIPMGFGLGVTFGPLMAGFLAAVRFEIPFIVGGLFSLLGAWIIYRRVSESVQPTHN
jgi:MFS family permease